VWVTVGSGAPHRLIATAMDEPGYVVSDITPDGYLRVQRLPQAPPNAVFDTLRFAQQVWVETWSGKKVNGVFAGLSVHLAPGRLNPPKMDHPDEMYVDIGARSAAEVRAAGVDLLDPVLLQPTATRIGNSGWMGNGTGDRFGTEVLLRIAQGLKEPKASGTTTIAFVTQQWLGGRGLNRLLTELTPDEMIFVGRVWPGKEAEENAAAKPGSGVLLGVTGKPSEANGLPGDLKALAQRENIPLKEMQAKAPRLAGYVKGASLPENFAELGVPTQYPMTPAEFLAWSDEGKLQSLLEAYLNLPNLAGGIGGGAGGGHSMSTIEVLTEAYGASGHEEAVRETVKRLLPAWAQKKVETDAAGNLILHLGNGKRNPKIPSVVLDAHMDEIGYEVKKIEDDGSLLVTVLGGGYTQYYLGHVALVHEADGKSVGGVMDLPKGWDTPVVFGKPGFEWPQGFRSMDEPVHVLVGTNSKEETEKLGIKEGDFVTIPKKYRALLGTMANARSFDDRVGDTALIEAVKELGPDFAEKYPGRDVTFVWTTREEVGLDGAAAYAAEAAKEGHAPDFVFAIDTFVSADSPLETKRFGDAEVGKGFVVRAVDNSNIVPLGYVERVVKLARENKIAVQYGVTGGGNDGAVYTRFGTVDVALGWPLRYSHSPAEVIDTRDMDALGKIAAVLAKEW